MLRDPDTSAHPSSDAEPGEKSFEGVKVFGVLEELIVAGFAAGELNSIDKDPRAMAQCVWASLHGLVSLLIVFRYLIGSAESAWSPRIRAFCSTV